MSASREEARLPVALTWNVLMEGEDDSKSDFHLEESGSVILALEGCTEVAAGDRE